MTYRPRTLSKVKIELLLAQLQAPEARCFKLAPLELHQAMESLIACNCRLPDAKVIRRTISKSRYGSRRRDRHIQ